MPPSCGGSDKSQWHSALPIQKEDTDDRLEEEGKKQLWFSARVAQAVHELPARVGARERVDLPR